MFSFILVFLALVNCLFGFIKLLDSWSQHNLRAWTACLLGYQNGIKLTSDQFFEFSVFVAELGKVHTMNCEVHSCQVKVPYESSYSHDLGGPCGFTMWGEQKTFGSSHSALLGDQYLFIHARDIYNIENHYV